MAGRNAVLHRVGAVATAVMGYDPMAAPGTGPFPGDNHLALAASLGLGTNDPKRIEVVGLSIKEARCTSSGGSRAGGTLPEPGRPRTGAHAKGLLRLATRKGAADAPRA